MQGLAVYKPQQGKYTRLGTVAGVMVLTAWGCWELTQLLTLHLQVYIAFAIPLAVFVGIGALMAWIVNRPKSADFLIATEGEMKKVSWSSRKEIIGSTKVVIITTFIMAAVLFLVDLVFVQFFKIIGVTGG